MFAINVCHSIFGPIPVPGYHPEGMYEFKIDLNSDAIEDLTYRITFKERDHHGNQRYVVRSIRGADAVDPHAPGTIVAQGVTGETAITASGLQTWAGHAGDPFWIEPDVLHAVGHAFQDGTTVNLAGWNPRRAKNLFAGHTVYSIVLEVPDSELLPSAGDQRHIGVWAVSTLATDAGGWRSINRIGLPMIHPLFTQYNEDLGNRLNAGRPSDDFATYGEPVTKAIAAVVSAYGTAEDPKSYAEKSGAPLIPEHSSLRRRNAGGVRLRRMERPFAHGQRTGRHVLHSGEHSHQPWDRQGLGHVEALDHLPIRPRRRGTRGGSRGLIRKLETQDSHWISQLS